MVAAPGGLLSSPRRRRRLAWIGVLLALAAGTVAILALAPSTHRAPEVFSNERAQVIETPRPVALTAAMRRDSLAVADTFLKSAVAREDVARSWAVVDPALRGGLTREQWASGDIPVVPFPVDSAIYRLDYAYERLVAWKVTVYPKRGSAVPAAVFFLDVKRGADDRWRVATWSPVPTGMPAAEEGDAASPFDVTANLGGSYEGRISPVWLLLPVGLVGGVVLAVAGIGVRDWRRTARARREYR